MLSVTGVADAIHIATYYVGNILIQHQEAHGAVERTYRQARPPRAFNEGMGGGGGPAQGYYPNPYQPHVMPAAPAGPLQTQQIYIPNDLVGCIIGKGGVKINEIRQASASQIKIMEPGAVGMAVNGQQAGPPNEGERLVVITGQPQNITMAVGMLYHVSHLCTLPIMHLTRSCIAPGRGEAKANGSTRHVKLASVTIGAYLVKTMDHL